MSYSFPGGASPSYPPAQLPPQSGHYGAQQGRYSPQPGYTPSSAAYGGAGGYQPSVPRTYSPQPPTVPLQPAPAPAPGAPGAPGAQGQQMIQPGTITYTTSVGPDGRTVYHPFRAVPASYQTPQGVVSGIQWIPAEATNVIPAGAQPANADFAASWNRGHLSADDKRAIEKWQRDEEKRRRNDEKEAAKRVQEWERERKEHEREERRAQQGTRERRRSTYGTTPAPPGAGVIPPGAVPAGYPTSAYDREYGSSAGSPELARRLNEMSINNDPYTAAAAAAVAERRSSTGPAYAMPRSRRGSFNAGYEDPAAAAAAARSTVGSDYAGRQSVYGSAYAGSAGGYGQAPAPGRPISRNASPYGGPAPLPPSRSPRPADAVLPGAPVIPGGYGVPTTYVAGGAPPPAASPYGGAPPPAASPYGGAAGRPVSPYKTASPLPGAGGAQYGAGRPVSPYKAASPLPGLPGNAYGTSPAVAAGMPPIVPYQGSNSRPPSRVGGQVAGGYAPEPAVPTGPPEAFSRPPNRSQPYTPFDPISLRDLDNMVDFMPRMPLVLVPHDVQHQDWIRFMTDITLAWTGKMPVPPGSRLPRPSTAVADLVELWNTSFFIPRHVELVLYKGRERRTGPEAGAVDDLPALEEGLEFSESSEEESEDSDAEEARYSAYGYPGAQGQYGGSARDTRRARRAERKQRRKEKRERRRAREMQKRYQLVVVYAPPAAPTRATPMYR